jgi:hypothetical protein
VPSWNGDRRSLRKRQALEQPRSADPHWNRQREYSISTTSPPAENPLDIVAQLYVFAGAAEVALVPPSRKEQAQLARDAASEISNIRRLADPRDRGSRILGLSISHHEHWGHRVGDQVSAAGPRSLPRLRLALRQDDLVTNSGVKLISDELEKQKEALRELLKTIRRSRNWARI